MAKNTSPKKQARVLHTFKKIHRTTGIMLFVFFFIVSATGLLLGWKKNSEGTILPKSYVGTSTELKKWLSIDSLHNIACKTLHDSVSPGLSLNLDRIDIRKSKGMIKFVFTDHYWEVQLDGANGAVLNIGQRRSDIIENIHDGSILDHYFKTKGEPIKVVYTSIMGLALLTFTITGIWLWYAPKRIKREKRKNR